MKRFVLVPVVILKTRTGYNGFSPAVEGCVASDRTIDATLKRMREALKFHFEGLHLLKQFKTRSAENVLKSTFKNYGDDAFYAALKIPA